MDNKWFDINDTKIVYYLKEIDYKTGVLYRKLIVEFEGGKQVQIESYRTASMENPNLAGIKYSLTPLNFSGEIKFQTGLNGRILNAGVDRYKSLNQQHLRPVDQGVVKDTVYLEVETTASNIRIVEAEKVRTCYKGRPLKFGQDLQLNIDV